MLPLTMLAFLPDLADLSGDRPAMVAFRDQIAEAIDLSQEMVAAGEADPMDWAVLNGAIRTVLRIAGNPPPSCPLILPLRNGGIGVEWHERGLNIELRFRTMNDASVLVVDATNILPGYSGRDPGFVNAGAALHELQRRLTA